MRLIGIDPGLRNVGWGIIAVEGPSLRHVANGTVRAGGTALSERLLALHEGLSAVIAEHAPTSAAMETVFVNRDGAGTLKLGQARGVALLALAQAGLEVGEYAPNAVKKAITGVGHAAKAQIEHMVKLELPGVEVHSSDSADALAVAICHAIHVRQGGRIAAALGAR